MVDKSSSTFQSTDVFVIFNVGHQNICCCFAPVALPASLCDSYQKCVSYYCLIPFFLVFHDGFLLQPANILHELVKFWIFLCSVSIIATLISFFFFNSACGLSRECGRRRRWSTLFPGCSWGTPVISPHIVHTHKCSMKHLLWPHSVAGSFPPRMLVTSSNSLEAFYANSLCFVLFSVLILHLECEFLLFSSFVFCSQQCLPRCPFWFSYSLSKPAHI